VFGTLDRLRLSGNAVKTMPEVSSVFQVWPKVFAFEAEGALFALCRD
jgi:hypothetical protein